jgi:hypothetical protein
MPSAARQYTGDLKRQLRFLASWPPSVRVELGDIGTIDQDNIFIRVSSLAALGIPFKGVAASEGSENFQYASDGSVDVDLKLAGKTSSLTPNVPLAKAGLGIHFTKEHATVFRADGAQHSRIDDQIALRDEVLSLIRAGRWERDWSIVIHVVHAASTTALMSSSAGSGIEFELGAEVQAGGLELLSAGVGLRTVARRAMQLEIVGTGGATPLFRAVCVKRRYFVGRRELRAAYSDELQRILAADEEPDEDLFEDTPIYNGAPTTPQDAPPPGGVGSSGR